MQDYQVRVMREAAELSEKITKLEKFITDKIVEGPQFISDGISELDKGLLLAQCAAMKTYEHILGLRIALFEPDGL